MDTLEKQIKSDSPLLEEEVIEELIEEEVIEELIEEEKTYEKLLVG